MNVARRKYLRRPDQAVTAVRLALDTEGFSYRKWGHLQRCKPGDWLVSNRGDVYTVDADSFQRTYRQLEEGRYLKVTPVWAEVASEAGAVATKEGFTHYAAGDYLVCNEENGTDTYAIPAAKFQEMYEPAPQGAGGAGS
jgi:hypothetical protein